MKDITTKERNTLIKETEDIRKKFYIAAEEIDNVNLQKLDDFTLCLFKVVIEEALNALYRSLESAADTIDNGRE